VPWKTPSVRQLPEIFGILTVPKQNKTRRQSVMVTIIKGKLSIGSYKDALDPSGEITALLCVASERDLKNPVLFYHKIPIIDMRPVAVDQLKEAVLWIEKHIDINHIMVFCNAGVGRSSSVVIAYLCCIMGYGFGEAVEYVAVRKPYISPLPNLLLSIEDVKRDISLSGGKKNNWF